jgi:hypothetical protein
VEYQVNAGKPPATVKRRDAPASPFFKMRNRESSQSALVSITDRMPGKLHGGNPIRNFLGKQAVKPGNRWFVVDSGKIPLPIGGGDGTQMPSRGGKGH